MRRIAVPVALTAFLIQVVACAGGGRGADPGEVVVAIGSQMSVSLERDANGRVRPSVPSIESSLDAYVDLAFSDESTYRMLRITNRSKFNLWMSVLICIERGTRCAESTVLPLGPGGSTYESWSEPIDVIRLFDFQLEELKADSALPSNRLMQTGLLLDEPVSVSAALDAAAFGLRAGRLVPASAGQSNFVETL